MVDVFTPVTVDVAVVVMGRVVGVVTVVTVVMVAVTVLVVGAD